MYMVDTAEYVSKVVFILCSSKEKEMHKKKVTDIMYKR